jgi:hypothetical protein
LFKVQSSKFKVQSSKFKVQSSKFKVQSSEMEKEWTDCMEPCTGYRKSERGAAGPTSESKQ